MKSNSDIRIHIKNLFSEISISRTAEVDCLASLRKNIMKGRDAELGDVPIGGQVIFFLVIQAGVTRMNELPSYHALQITRFVIYFQFVFDVNVNVSPFF